MRSRKKARRTPKGSQTSMAKEERGGGAEGYSAVVEDERLRVVFYV